MYKIRTSKLLTRRKRPISPVKLIENDWKFVYLVKVFFSITVINKYFQLKSIKANVDQKQNRNFAYQPHKLLLQGNISQKDSNIWQRFLIFAVIVTIFFFIKKDFQSISLMAGIAKNHDQYFADQSCKLQLDWNSPETIVEI